MIVDFVPQQICVAFKGEPRASLHLGCRLTCTRSLDICWTRLAIPIQPVLSYLMHVDVFETDGGITYAGDGVVEERVSLLEGLEILCRDGLVSRRLV